MFLPGFVKLLFLKQAGFVGRINTTTTRTTNFTASELHYITSATTAVNSAPRTTGESSSREPSESPGPRLPALVWKIHLLHGAQTRLVQNAAIAGDAPGTLSRLGTERVQGQCAALLKITQEIPVGL